MVFIKNLRNGNFIHKKIVSDVTQNQNQSQNDKTYRSTWQSLSQMKVTPTLVFKEKDNNF